MVFSKSVKQSNDGTNKGPSNIFFYSIWILGPSPSFTALYFESWFFSLYFFYPFFFTLFLMGQYVNVNPSFPHILSKRDALHVDVDLSKSTLLLREN
jgi:hypothetical protein